MSSDDATTTERDRLDETQSKVETLEEHVSPDNPLVTERLSVAQTRIEEYEQADSEREKHDRLDQIEAELDKVRTAIEDEVRHGTERAHDLLDQIEAAVAKLR